MSLLFLFNRRKTACKQTNMVHTVHIVHMVLQSFPAFDYASVTPDAAGLAIVRNFTMIDYPAREQQLLDMGKSDMIVALVSAVCSNLHLVEVFCDPNLYDIRVK